MRGDKNKWITDKMASYELNKKKIVILRKRLELLVPSCTSNVTGLPRGSDTTDQTGNMAIKRAEIEREIKELELDNLCIEQAGIGLTGKKKEIFEYYLNGKKEVTQKEICDESIFTKKKFYSAYIELMKDLRELLNSGGGLFVAS